MKPRTFKKNQFLRIIWIDAEEEVEWYDAAGLASVDASKSATFLEHGFYLKSSNDYLYVSHVIGIGKNLQRGVSAIPWGCIKKLSIVKGVKP